MSESPHTRDVDLHDPATLVSAALERLQRGDGGAAETLCREALALSPDHPGALGVLGMMLYGAGRTGEAHEVFDRLTQLAPNEPLHWMNLGTARRALGRYDDALKAFMVASELGERSADFFYNVGLTHVDRHDYEAARAVLKRAAELAPRDAAIRFEYAKACYESLQTEEAVTALADWEQLEGIDAPMLAGIGHGLMRLGETASAELAVRRLAQAGPLEPRACLTLAQIYERTNRLDEADALLAQLVRDPRSRELGAELAATQAQLAQRRGEHTQAVALFERCLERTPEFHTRHHELFGLARSLDALGRFAEAFATLIEAHRSQAEYIKLAAPIAYARGAPAMTITEYGCDPDDVASWGDSAAPTAAESPIFIVAFPRSGTTLLELTLDAHPDLVSMDEQPFVQAALDDLLATGIRYPEQLGRVSAAELQAVRARYWERAHRKVVLARGQRLVDKNPLNMLRLPAICRLFPNARIVLAVRHPCDVLLSCFMQHFRAPDFALLCRDLESLANGYRRAFDFWYEQARILQPAVHEVRYETFVADFEPQVRALLSFLEVPWNDAVLAPAARAQAKGYISTPSYSQVVQPIYQNSVGRWKSYEAQLRPIMSRVQPYLERWGYAEP
ncbi:MAG TPA: sulfotransferase [Steroidobacteraceae bacterium]|nr:sulfotransferase [Steroidobacteraceae bacterium]